MESAAGAVEAATGASKGADPVTWRPSVRTWLYKYSQGGSSRSRGRLPLVPMIVVLVFVPLFALSGMEGRLFAPLARPVQLSNQDYTHGMKQLVAAAMIATAVAGLQAQEIDYPELWAKATPFHEFLEGVRARREQWPGRSRMNRPIPGIERISLDSVRVSGSHQLARVDRAC